MTIPQILITPPWEEKGSRIRKPTLPDCLIVSALPDLLLKENGLALANEYVENLLGLLYSSTINQLAKPLTDESFQKLLHVFTTESLHRFGRFIYDLHGYTGLQYAWIYPLEPKDTAEICSYIERNVRFNNAAGDIKMCRNLVMVLAINFLYTGSKPAIVELHYCKNDKTHCQLSSSQEQAFSFLIKSMANHKLINNDTPHLLLTREQLEHYGVSNFGFNKRGRKKLILGSRELEIYLDSYLTCHILSENRRLKSLPNPRKDDDIEAFRLLKKAYSKEKKALAQLFEDNIQHLCKQAKRQETFYISHFVNVYLNNPILHKIAQNIVWAWYSYTDKNIPILKKVFIISDDGSWLQSNYDELNPQELIAMADNNDFITILEPACISETEQKIFADMLADFDIVQPFEQINKKVTARLTDAEKQQRTITRFQEQQISMELLGSCSRSYTEGLQLTIYDKKQALGHISFYIGIHQYYLDVNFFIKTDDDDDYGSYYDDDDEIYIKEIRFTKDLEHLMPFVLEKLTNLLYNK